LSDAAPIRERVNPRRPRSTHPMQKTPWPWHDRSGRFSWLKTVVLVLECVPAIWIAFALVTGRLGARPILEANHEAGLWAIRFLMLTLLATPARAIFNWHRLVLVRRQLGLTTLFYALAHVVLYAWDEKWNLHTVASEILLRFYLEVGFVALVALALLGVTSTDRALRTLGHAWKRLHRIIYLLTVLALFHYFLQTKANVAEPILLTGLFIWLMGWRLLPSGPDRQPLPVLGLGIAATVLTAVVEFAWYALATRISPMRVIRSETDLSYGPHSVGQVFLVCLCMAIATALFWARHRERLRKSIGFDIALYAGGAVIASALLFAFNLTDSWLPDDWTFWQAAGCLVAAGVLLGLLRSMLPRQQRVLDAICTLAVLLPLIAGLTT
jgi:sulfoxide reductase heme-binding subunit YedZ